MPVAVRFAPDGTVFVAEKRGTVQRFAELGDPTPELVVDVRAATHDFWDRGLIGLAVDPGYPARPYVYVSYAYDPGNRWNDDVPDAARGDRPGLRVDGRISRVRRRTPAGDRAGRGLVPAVPEPQRRRARVRGRRRAYASAGDGASFNYADERPTASRPDNPCGDPSRGEGGSSAARTCARPATRSGSTARSCASTRTPARPCPATRWFERRTPTRASSAYGLRNPFRITFRPGHQRALGRRRRLEHVGGDQPGRRRRPTRRRQLRLAVLRGRRASSRASTR